MASRQKKLAQDLQAVKQQQSQNSHAIAKEGLSPDQLVFLNRELEASLKRESELKNQLTLAQKESARRRQVLDRSTFPTRASGPFDAIHVERGAVLQPYPTEAAGKLFVDDHINPGETIHRSLIVSLPPGAYAAQVDVLVPVLTREPPKGNALLGGRVLEWGYDKSDVVIPLLCAEGNPSDCQRLDDPDKQDLLMDRKLKAFDSNYFLNEQSVQVGLSGGS
jgi:hypothetical protein